MKPFRIACAFGLIATAVAPRAHGQHVAVDVADELRVVRAAMATPELTAALAYIGEKQLAPHDILQEWIGLCNAYGPSGDEVYRSRHIKKLFQIYGLERVHIDDQWNVIGIREGVGNGPKVVLAAHHDVVAMWPKDQPIEAFIADERVWCPGAGDALIGVVQILGVLRAMNAAGLQTDGDVWFVTFTGEETTVRGGQQFARANYPHNIDWRRGDVIAHLHGGAGDGVSTGSRPIIHDAQLYVFTPFERQIAGEPGADRRWRPHAVDALARMIIRIRAEVADSRPDCQRCDDMGEAADFYMNMAMIEAMPIRNTPGSEANIQFDRRASTSARVRQAHQQIMTIAEEVCQEIEGCRYHFAVNQVIGREDEIPGWDKVNNAGARMAAAAGQALYGGTPTIDPTRGCGDCQGTYMFGMPSMSFRGNVVDYAPGKWERTNRFGQYGGLESRERVRTSGHHITQSQAIPTLWSPMKHALVFAAAYAGIARTTADGGPE
jgi:acetylornithine deacetylase/succinyl-diaminopimelate desuccinylase-like protein